MNDEFDALLLLSFGGPEGPDDVIPFLENVLRGKHVPHERLLEVAEHYQRFGGKSPINDQNRAIIAALTTELEQRGPKLPIYWGNRNWHPLLADTLREMQRDGVRHALAIFTSAYSSYSGCRQYLEDIDRARAEVGAGAPRIDKIRAFFNHPDYIDAVAEHVKQAIARIPTDRHETTRVIYTAHSIPIAMSAGCDYAAQLAEACRLVNERTGGLSHALVYQSRSGPPHQPWLEPDVRDYLQDQTAVSGVTDVVVSPIGFVSDHLEVLYDLDIEARQKCKALSINMIRARTAGTHPAFIRMLRELIAERVEDTEPRWLGTLGICPDKCPADCCPSGRSPTTSTARKPN